MPTIIASSAPRPTQKIGDRIRSGRDKFEKPRSVTSKRLNEDVKKTAQQEIAFAKQLLRQLIPLQVSIDKTATGIKKLIPLNFAVIGDDETSNANTNSKSQQSNSVATAISAAVLDDDVYNAAGLDEEV